MPSGDRAQQSFGYYSLQEVYLLEPPEDLPKLLAAVRALPRVRRVEYAADRRRLLVLGEIAADRIVEALHQAGWEASLRPAASPTEPLRDSPTEGEGRRAESPAGSESEKPPVQDQSPMQEACSHPPATSNGTPDARPSEPSASPAAPQGQVKRRPALADTSKRDVPGRARLAWMATLSFAMGVALGVLPEAWPVAVGFWALSMILAGAYPARSALRTLQARRLDANVLVLVSALGALVLQRWLEAAFVLLIFAVGETVAARCLTAPSRAADALKRSLAQTANVVDDSGEHVVAVESVSVGQFVRIPGGEIVPLDGRIVDGDTVLEETLITGEAVPAAKRLGAFVFAGSVNMGDDIVVRVERPAALRRLLTLIHRIEGAPTPAHRLQGFIDPIAGRYTSVLTYVAFATAFIPPLVFGEALRDWLYRGLLVLIMAMSSSAILVPRIHVAAAWVRATRAGILVANVRLFERLATVRTVVLTHFGVLTQGRWQVSDVCVHGDLHKADALRKAASLASRASTPMHEAIAFAAREAGLTLAECTHTEGDPATGIAGIVAEATGTLAELRLGSLEWFTKSGFAIPSEARQAAEEAQSTGQHIVGLADAGKRKLLAWITLRDPVREESRRLVSRMQRIDRRLRLLLVSGEEPARAEWVAQQIGLQGIVWAPTDEAKIEALEAKREDGGNVLWVANANESSEVYAAADAALSITGDADEHQVIAQAQILSHEVSRVPYVLSLARYVEQSITWGIAAAVSVKVVMAILLVMDRLTLPIAMSFEVMLLVAMAWGAARRIPR